MTIDMTPRQLADLIATSVAAALRIAAESAWPATDLDIAAMARAVGGNAAQQIYNLSVPE